MRDAQTFKLPGAIAELVKARNALRGNLRKAPAALETAVDRLYRPAPFASDRVEHLLGRYEALVNRLERLGAAKNMRVARKVQSTGEHT